MRYEAGSSRYRILSLYKQDPVSEKEGFTIRTASAPKGAMDTEKYLQMFGVHADIFAPLQREIWTHNLNRHKAERKVEMWRKASDNLGLTKSIRFDQDYSIVGAKQDMLAPDIRTGLTRHIGRKTEAERATYEAQRTIHTKRDLSAVLKDHIGRTTLAERPNLTERCMTAFKHYLMDVEHEFRMAGKLNEQDFVRRIIDNIK